MEKDLYAYTLETVEKYPRIMKIRVVNNLIKDGIATRNQKETEKIFIGDKNDDDKLIYCLSQNSEELVKYIEKWEFQKYYKHSILYLQSKTLCIEEVLKKLLTEKSITKFDERGETESLRETLSYPSFMEDEKYYYFKFSMKLNGMDTNGEVKMKRNTALICIAKETYLIEIRFDTIETLYSVDKTKYIKNLISWLKNYLDPFAEPLDLDYVLDEIRSNGSKDGVIVAEQHMEMASGAQATVAIGKNESMELPFLTEIKSIMSLYEEELNSVPELKSALKEYLYEKEEMSVYPWITLLFTNKKFEVKFTKDYNGIGICLLQHFSSTRQENVGRERMEDVTEYLVRVGERIGQQWNRES